MKRCIEQHGHIWVGGVCKYCGDSDVEERLDELNAIQTKFREWGQEARTITAKNLVRWILNDMESLKKELSK